MKKIILWFLVASLLVWEIMEYRPVKICIANHFTIWMPLKDKKRLDYFFRNVCFLNMWTYTLMGSKPMSIYQYTKPWAAFRKVFKYAVKTFHNSFQFPNFREICYLLTPEQFRIKLGLNTLNKYTTLFPNSRFALFIYCDKEDVVCFALVDKVKFVDIVKRHLGDFRGKLQGMDPEGLYNSERLYLFLKNLDSDGLMGTVLGFGRDNAWLYQESHKINLQENPMISMWPGEENVWLDRINEKDLSFQPWDVSDLFYPLFACDPQSAETELLKQTYREEREKIIKYYEGKDVVEATLALFNQELKF